MLKPFLISHEFINKLQIYEYLVIKFWDLKFVCLPAFDGRASDFVENKLSSQVEWGIL